jgi:hypothetical protein
MVLVGAVLIAMLAPAPRAEAAGAEPAPPRVLTVGTWDTDMVPWAGNTAAVRDTVAATNLDVLALQGVWTDAARQAILSDPRIAAKYPYSFAPDVKQASVGCDDTVTPGAFQETWIDFMVQTGADTRTLAKSIPMDFQAALAGLQVALTSQACHAALTAAMASYAEGADPVNAIEDAATAPVQYLFDGSTGQLILSARPLEHPEVDYFDHSLYFLRSTVRATVSGVALAFADWPRNYFADIDPELGPFFLGPLQTQAAQGVVAHHIDVLLGDVKTSQATADGTTGYQPGGADVLTAAGYHSTFDQATYCPAASHAGSTPCQASQEVQYTYPDPLPLDNVWANARTSCSRVGTFASTPVSSHVGLIARCTVFPTTQVLDTFDRPDRAPLQSWRGVAASPFYRVGAHRLLAHLGGPLVWNEPFGQTQEAWVTLAKIDPSGTAQGLLLKAQAIASPDAGAISVLYDARAKKVRVSTLRLGARSWTSYAPLTQQLANGDRLGARATSAGTVEVYRNRVLLGTVTLTASDKAFFAGRGGRIGLWTGPGTTAYDDFGGGTAGTQ